MKGLNNYRITTRMRLKSITESEKCDRAIIKHYTFIMKHFEEIIAKQNAEIKEIEDRKEEIRIQFFDAPKKIEESLSHLKELSKKRNDVEQTDSKVKRLKKLREQLEALKYQCVLDNIDIVKTEQDIANLEKEAKQRAEQKRRENDMEISIEQMRSDPEYFQC